MKISSDYDWCESNHYYTPYIAEFWNTMSSIPVFTFGLSGFLHLLFKSKLDINTTNKINACAFALVAFVGIGSIYFHSTLTHEGQALDELLMLFSSSLCLFAVLRTRSKKTAMRNGMLLLILNIVVVYYYFHRGFVLFFVVYTLTVAALLIQSYFLVQESKSKWKRYQMGLLRAASLIYVGGFSLLWIPEQLICKNRLHHSHETILTSMQLHAFFHLTSALGSYSFCVFLTLSSQVQDGVSVTVKYAAFLSFGILLPRVLKKKA